MPGRATATRCSPSRRAGSGARAARPRPASANPAACAAGYIHLADVRYEVRDIQELDRPPGRRADRRPAADRRHRRQLRRRPVADARRAARPGDAARRQARAVAQPRRHAAAVAAAAPVIPWTDLVNAAAPNGRAFADAITPRSLATTPVGVEKASVVNAIFAAAQFATGPGQPTGEPFVPGRPMGFLAPPGSTRTPTSPAGWPGRTRASRTTTQQRSAVVDQLARYHSAYYVAADHRPPPLLISPRASPTTSSRPTRCCASPTARASAIRACRCRMLLGDFGHQRAANKPRERPAAVARSTAGSTTTCAGAAAAPQRGRRLRPDVPAQRALARARSAPRPSRGSRAARSAAPIGRAAAPELGRPRPGDRRRARPGRRAGRRLRRGPRPSPSPGRRPTRSPCTAQRGFTLLGAPTVAARISDQRSQAGRRGDRRAALGRRARRRHEAPGRPRALPAAAPARASSSQLHPGAWRFEPGHTLELELLGGDPPYARPSNSSFAIDVSRLRLRLPVRQRPGAAQVRHAGPPPLLPGQRRAP